MAGSSEEFLDCLQFRKSQQNADLNQLRVIDQKNGILNIVLYGHYVYVSLKLCE